MHHEALVSHIRSRIASHISIEEIRLELRTVGWTDEEISTALREASSPLEPIEKSSLRHILRKEVPVSIVLVIFLILLGTMSAFAYFYESRPVNYTINLPSAPEILPTQFTYGPQEALSNPDFFGNVKQKFISDKATFVEADLSAMKLRVYEDGIATLEVPIETKGRPGSWWETPAGLYRMSIKEKEHFSGMGHVWMPWSMNFQGNFFIHGNTYYPDGSPTSKQFTGGCIRLSTADAKRVYDLVTVGTPILVFEKSFAPDDFTYMDMAPDLSAPIYMAADLRNSHIFASKDITTQVPIASITKLMTALIATEYINLDSTATVPEAAIVYTSKARLTPGTKYSIYQLLFPLLTESSNEAAETIARFHGRDIFIKRMNEKATAIGMTHSHFADPSGASEDNTSTAEDLFILARYIYNNRSFVFKITSGTLGANAYGESGFKGLGNFNDFVGTQYFFGGKNGKTKAALETSLSVFEFPVDNDTRPIVLIVLRSPDDKKDSQKLLDFTKNYFK